MEEKFKLLFKIMMELDEFYKVIPKLEEFLETEEFRGLLYKLREYPELKDIIDEWDEYIIIG